MQTQKWKLAFEEGFIKGDLQHYTQTCTVTKVDICMSANKVSICASNPCDPKCQDLYCTKHTFSDPFFTLRSVWWPHKGECDKGKKTKKLPPIPTFCLQGSTNQKKLVLKELCVLKKRGATMTSFEVELRGCTKSQYKRNIMILNCGWWKCGSFGSTGMDGEGIES